MVMEIGQHVENRGINKEERKRKEKTYNTKHIFI